MGAMEMDKKQWYKILGKDLQEVNSAKDMLSESRYSRYASTDEQEEMISEVEKWAKKAKMPVRGGTTIGKHPQTVILDLTYQGSEIYINSDGEVKIGGKNIWDYTGFKKAIKNLPEY
jgi:hypothetical protein